MTRNNAFRFPRIVSPAESPQGEEGTNFNEIDEFFDGINTMFRDPFPIAEE